MQYAFFRVFKYDFNLKQTQYNLRKIGSERKKFE